MDSDAKLRSTFSPAGIREQEGGYGFRGPAIQYFLPHRGRMLLVDEVRRADPQKREIVARRSVAQNDPGLEGRRSGIFPSTLLIEALAQTCGFLMNVVNFLQVNGLEAKQLVDPSLDGRSCIRPPLSVLGESNMTFESGALVGDDIALHASARFVRNHVWAFDVRAATSGTLARGQIILAYPNESDLTG